VFCAFFAAVGAAIRNGTAATVRRVDVNSFFIVDLLVRGGPLRSIVVVSAAHNSNLPVGAALRHHWQSHILIPFFGDSRAETLMKESS
jgi:hypothetical protein